MHALVDGDIVTHRVGWTTNDESLDIAKYRADVLVENILQGVGATDYQIYLTDSEGNFRNQISTSYKANRKKEKPKWLEELKEYLISTWKAKISLGQEADDALGIKQTEMETAETVICSIDKDLLQIPGYHYNFVKTEHSFITPEEGLYNFYKQLLVGDSTDNVDGCPKTGEVKAVARLSTLKGSSDECGFFEETQAAYRSANKKGYFKKELTDQEVDDIILVNARLLYIRKKEEEIWQIPKKQNSQIQNISTSPPAQSPADQL